MSADGTSDDADNLDLPAIARDAISTGAAADSAEDDRLKGLHRLLRYALLVSANSAHFVEQRLIAEIDELCPQLPQSAAWAAALTADAGLALAAELDHRAVTQNEPNLRSLSDCVRLLCLPVPRDATYFEDYRRVGKALVQAFRKIEHNRDEQLCCDLERFVFGWAALPACTDLMWKKYRAAVNASIVGATIAEHRVSAAKTAAHRRAKGGEKGDKKE